MRKNEVYGDYKILSCYKNQCTVQCIVCGRTQTVTPHAIKKRINEHGNICSKIVIKEHKDSHSWQFYRIWQNMRTRTTNPNYEKWHRYGGRGINSNEFRYFVDFYDLMYTSYIEHVNQYGEKNTTLDRVDNNKNYCSDNCCWKTWLEQTKNKSNLLHFEATSPSGEVFYGVNLKEFCEKHNLSYQNAISGIHQNNQSWKNGWFFKVM